MSKLNKALVLALVAFGCLSLSPVNADEAQVVASLPSTATSADPALDQAMDLIRKARTLQQQNGQQKQTAPAVIRSHRFNSDHTYILGGGAAFPM